MIFSARYLALKHSIFGKRIISEPKNGIDLLRNLNKRHFERWGGNNDYYTRDDSIFAGTGLLISAHPNKNTYFNRKLWKWSYDPKDEKFTDKDGRFLGYDNKYTHSSGRCDTKDKVVIDVYKPGRIISKCTIPQEGPVAAIWIYFEEHPQDRHHPDRDVYFELDIFESEPRKPESVDSKKGVIFTHWLGKYMSDAAHKTIWMFKRFSSTHYPELTWDGKGTFTWKLDGVCMKKVKLELPDNLEPYVIYSLGVATDLTVNSKFSVDWSRYEKYIR